MIYVFENSNNKSSIVYNENTLTEEQKLQGIAINELPEKNIPDGKMAVLCCKKETGEVWWEYVDIIEEEVEENFE
jgi:hypothetical protein